MSKKRTKYTSAFKTKLVLELLQNESTLVQIASKHKGFYNWKNHKAMQQSTIQKKYNLH
jgi:putative transposase